MKEVVETYRSDHRQRSRYQVAREVKNALKANAEVAKFEYTKEEKRLRIRHEVAHHIPIEHIPVAVFSRIGKSDESVIYDREILGVEHFDTDPLDEIKSAIAPLGDKRFKQRLSREDISIAIENLIKLLPF